MRQPFFVLIYAPPNSVEAATRWCPKSLRPPLEVMQKRGLKGQLTSAQGK